MNYANCSKPQINRTLNRVFYLFGGEEEIRTLGEFYPTPLFESGTFNHSDTSPNQLLVYIKNINNVDL